MLGRARKIAGLLLVIALSVAAEAAWLAGDRTSTPFLYDLSVSE